ncbi:MAG: HAMP domain-containing sensor histidine kinase [Eubacteriales bacterium]|nr:HAMP domain-containing sensor histidine kinase [Eubacteriales bacterium]
MLKKVHLRLTFFCALVTAAILLVMTVFCLIISERGIKNKNYSDFQNNTSSILTYIDSQSTLSHTWLSQMESRYHLVIDIRDGVSPLLYGNLHAHDIYADVLSLARETAANDYHLSLKTSGGNRVLVSRETFRLRDDENNGYFATVALLPKGNGYLDIAILSSDSISGTQIIRQRILFGIGALVSFFILTAFAWIFTGRMLQPVEESRKRQTAFIASASHELRSPLTVILSSLSAARSASAGEQPRFFNAMESEGKRMANLINDMLMLANSDNHTWHMTPAATEPDTLLLETYEKYESGARQRNLHLQIHLPDDTVPICIFDKERISQMLSILIENAFSYTPAGGTVLLSLKVLPKYLALTVSDNGPGIPDDQKEKIFERFYRADESHQDRDHFGLGLCIAKEISDLHKGKIQVMDTPGGGATFTVMLPR